jgi:hypothetical protein
MTLATSQPCCCFRLVFFCFIFPPFCRVDAAQIFILFSPTFFAFFPVGAKQCEILELVDLFIIIINCVILFVDV